MHIRFVHKYIPDSLDLTAELFSTLRRYVWPDVLGVVIIVLVVVLDHLLDLSNGVDEFPGILMNDLLDIHALLVFIFYHWRSEVDDLWDALSDTDRWRAGGDRLDGLRRNRSRDGWNSLRSDSGCRRSWNRTALENVYRLLLLAGGLEWRFLRWVSL